jgi:hypothetical protein
VKYAEFRQLCLSLPEAEERETWGEATFRVRGRIFAIGSPEARSVSLKASLDDQAGLVAMDPKTFSVSAYTGRFGWVTVRLAGVGGELAGRLVKNAWERTAPRRLTAQNEPGSRKLDDGSRDVRRKSARSAKAMPRR